MKKFTIQVTSSGPFSLTITTGTDETIDVHPDERIRSDATHSDLRAPDDDHFYDKEAAVVYEDGAEDDSLVDEDGDEDEDEYEEAMIAYQQYVAALSS
jgi:hypothetical protein